MPDAVIISAVRTPVGRGGKGTLATVRPDDLAALVLHSALERVGLTGEAVEDVLLGCAIPEAEQGLNVARLSALRAGFPDSVCGVTVNRFCASGLQTIAMASAAITAGMNHSVLAGGVESMSFLPMSGFNPSPNPALTDHRAGVYLGMGLTAEKVASRYQISRQDQDIFALESHQKASAAQDAGIFTNELVEVTLTRQFQLNQAPQALSLKHDELVRKDSNLTALAQLKASFKLNGSITAGNASPLSDGAAALLLMSAEHAQQLGLQPLGRLVTFATAGVDPEYMGIGPVLAIPKALKQAGLSLADIDLIELNEAFAAQALAVIRELDLPLDKLNVHGGAIALGHPLGATGAKLSCTLLYALRRLGKRYGLVSMCIGGGMGAAAIFEAFPN